MGTKHAKIYVGGVETGTIVVEPEPRGAKGILEFPLPEEQNRFDVACKGLDFARAWDRLKCWLRDETKYGELPAEEYAAIHRVRNLVYQIETEFNLPELE